MSFTIVRKGDAPAPSPAPRKRTIVIKRRPRPEDGLKRLKFKGKIVDRPIQFPDDVAYMQGVYRSLGYHVPDRDAQEAWVELSRRHCPWRKVKEGERPWLRIGFVHDHFKKAIGDLLIEEA